MSLELVQKTHRCQFLREINPGLIYIVENAFAPGLIIISPVYNSLNGLRQKVNGRHISPTLLLAVNLFPSSRVHLLRVLNLGAPWAQHGSTYSYRLTVRVILEKRG